MYVLQFLAGNFDAGITSEYRLLCSGELFNKNVRTFDYQKSEPSRWLLAKPFNLRVVSQPFYDYPQELRLVFSCPAYVTEGTEHSSLTFPPNDDIAKDLAAFLTVFLRRLVTVYSKISVAHRDLPPSVKSGEFAGPYPLPIANASTPTNWKRKPYSVETSMEGQQIIDHNPKPVPVDSDILSAKLNSVPKLDHPEAYLRAVRLYTEAMRVIEDWPEMAYQLLVYSVEAIAGAVYRDYRPSRAEMITTKKQVARHAQELNVPKEGAEDLAVIACEGVSWSRRKFKLFLAEMVDGDLAMPDDLFVDLKDFAPNLDKFETFLNNIYNGRSGVAHGGNAFGDAIRLGMGPTIPARVSHEILSGRVFEIPPVCWFERVVNFALNGYLCKAVIASGREDTISQMAGEAKAGGKMEDNQAGTEISEEHTRPPSEPTPKNS
jgi:hypothetical protein